MTHRNWMICGARGISTSVAEAYHWLWDLVGGPALKKIDASRKQPCAFLGNVVKLAPCANCVVHACKLFGSCTTSTPSHGHAFCMVCPEFLPQDAPVDAIIEKLDSFRSLNVIGIQKVAESV